jgi:hypothetical protein
MSILVAWRIFSSKMSTLGPQWDSSGDKKNMGYDDGVAPTNENSTTTIELPISNWSHLLGGLVPRAYSPWPHGHASLCAGPGWNPPLMKRSDDKDYGLLFLKTFKTGSSTTSGINLRIARGLATKVNHSDVFCPCGFHHGVASEKKYAHRDPQRSFLWTILREPTHRIQSEFFHFAVSRAQREPSDDNFKSFVRRQRNGYLNYVPLVSKTNASHIEKIAMMQSVLDDYNFIAITERLDESLVVLQMLLNVPMGDLLYLNAKGSGGYDGGGYKGKCYYITPKFVSPGMKDFFQSPVWQMNIQYDAALYHAANLALDMTIEQLGSAEFQNRLETFKALQQKASKLCDDVKFPCSSTGKKLPREQLDCFWEDSGCGATCLDGVAAGNEPNGTSSGSDRHY